MQARLPVRFAYRLHERLGASWASTLLVSCYGLAYFVSIGPSDNRDARFLAIAKHANARRQVTRVASWVGASDCGWVRAGIRRLPDVSALMALPRLASPRRLRRTLRIVRTIDRRYGFLVACRAAAAIAWYARGRTILAAHRPGAILVSSDSNPEEVGFAAAARSLGIPQVFVAHAYPTPFSPPLDFTLSILEGEAAVDARERKGPVKGDILLAGLEGDSVPLDPGRLNRSDPVIGIFAPKAVSWATLAAIVDDCRRRFRAKQIVIRWHPSRLDPARRLHLLGDLSGIVESPTDASLPDVARLCDWVIADENSNVHLPVLKLGIPTIAVKRLGLYPESRSDMYGFVARGIVFPPVRSIAEVRADALTAFFADGWAARFKRYDAAYLRTQEAVGSEVRRTILALLENSTSKAVGV